MIVVFYIDMIESLKKTLNSKERLKNLVELREIYTQEF